MKVEKIKGKWSSEHLNLIPFVTVNGFAVMNVEVMGRLFCQNVLLNASMSRLAAAHRTT